MTSRAEAVRPLSSNASAQQRSRHKSAELWLYGFDWDEKEHIVYLKHRSGKWMRLGYVAPAGHRKGNEREWVIVIPLANRDDWLVDGKMYVEIYNPPGGYIRTALKLFALLPPMGSTSASAKAALAGKDLVVVADQVEAANPPEATYHWHAHPDAAWWFESGWALVTLGDARLWFTSSQGIFSAADLHRLPGSRGQFTVTKRTPASISRRASRTLCPQWCRP